MSLWKRLNWVNTIFLILSPLIVWIFVPLHIISQGLSWPLVISFILFCIATSVSITGGYHRLFAHKSYEASTLVRLVYLIFGAAAIQGSALKWCSDHRRHHRYVDTDNDPYTIKKGFFYAHMGWVFLKEQKGFESSFAPDLQKDKWVQWQSKYYLLLAIGFGFLFPTLVGAIFGHAWEGLLYGGFARVVFTHHCTFLINSACHYFGSQPYSDRNTARDSFVLSLFTYGEGYHNFHHRFQADYRNGIRWYQWDPTKWLIHTASFLGLTWNLKKVSDEDILKARLAAEEKRLRTGGIPEDRIVTLRQKIEEAQIRVRHLKEMYQGKKQELLDARDEKIEQLRVELELAKIEFRFALKQWQVCLRYA